ncbi:MAG: sulfatase-like hydrolase/transferase [Verrucomicrobiota bacterium]
MKTLRSILFLVALPFLTLASPNIVIFLADDQGWGDLTVNGNNNLKTPHIDSLAHGGATLTNFYVCAVCAPTRAEFLTGRYHPKTGVSGVSEGSGRLNPDETTLSQLFQKAGYATGCFGKWHNGTQSPYHPNDRGFDEFYGFTSGHWGHYFSPPLDQNGTMVKGEGYITDDITSKAIEFIKASREGPFLCYIPLPTPHSPFYVDDEFYDRFANADPAQRHREPEKEDLAETRAVLAMTENIDWNVGRVLTTLDELNLSEDTIVFYFTDNGPNTERWNAGMKGRKGTTDEGGLRSPGFLRWPKQVDAGTTIDEVIGAIDLLPTMTTLAGVDATTRHSIDGRSFAALLDGSGAWPERSLFSVWRKKATVRTSRFRLDHEGALFDITNDRGQLNDVSDQFPKIAADLRKQLSDHRVEMDKEFARWTDRPFTVGYAEKTTLPARDGVPHGTIQRSSRAPNNSFFKNWTDEGDSITWNVTVGTPGSYRATVYYTCAEGDVGATIRLGIAGREATTESTVTEAFDPPLWDKSKERVDESHYFVKDFRPLELGILNLPHGRATLELTAPKIPGAAAIDVFSLVLVRE